MKSRLSSNIALIILFLFCIVITCNGQKVTVSPASVPIWGQTTGYYHFGVEYEGFGVHYFESNYGNSLYEKRWSANSNTGISFIPFNFKYFRLGAIHFIQNFPNLQGKKLNVWIEVSIPFYNFELKYIHISNANRSNVNPGVDFISLSYHL